MGMTYNFYVAKKGSIPISSYYDDVEGWTQVGPDLDREDWIMPSLFNSNYTFTKDRIEEAIAKLDKLDKDVGYILKKDDINIGFRRRLAEGLVRNIYEYRYYHYRFPSEYYNDDQKSMGVPISDEWFASGGSSFVKNVLKQLLQFANGEYEIRYRGI